MTDNTDFAQLAAWQQALTDMEQLGDPEIVHDRLKKVGFDVGVVVSLKGAGGQRYTVRLASWPTRTLHGQQVPLRTREALEGRVQKAGYSLRRYSNKSDDMFLVVE